MTENIEYEVFAPDGRSMGLVHGLQIGRFAVRDVWPVVHTHASHRYVVDHIPTGLKLTFAPVTFEDAVRFADDVSRFSEHDPDGRDISELMRQFGRRMVHWMSETRAKLFEGKTWSDYRTYYATEFKGFPDDVEIN